MYQKSLDSTYQGGLETNVFKNWKLQFYHETLKVIYSYLIYLFTLNTFLLVSGGKKPGKKPCWG